jgi:hypothetical protein
MKKVTSEKVLKSGGYYVSHITVYIKLCYAVIIYLSKINILY